MCVCVCVLEVRASSLALSEAGAKAANMERVRANVRLRSCPFVGSLVELAHSSRVGGTAQHTTHNTSNSNSACALQLQRRHHTHTHSARTYWLVAAA